MTAGAEPFGTFSPTGMAARLLGIAQQAPRNPLGKQLARIARAIYLWRAPSPADVTVGDLRLRCHLTDNTCERKFVFTPWRFDTRELAAIAEVMPGDGVFIDVGANVGIYSLHVATRLGPRGRVVAFEPFETAYRRLTFNIEATRAGRDAWPRIDAVCAGIADEEGSRELALDGGNLGGNSIAAAARFSDAGSTNRVRVACRPLLAALQDLEVARIDALKIDIEGAEDMALCPFLDAAPSSLLPLRIVLENSDASWKRDLRGALVARSYQPLLRTRLNSVYDLR